ncbi:site-2 protease family protein [Phormidium tenue]|uniref:Zinc metalloprotease n=1 Tax=Phormidium tenue NIES-30 TaxID=549789 RepID=A0A1U7J6P4_9CYAN|nr:site-2 protease family protein [Phormidium tenue]MBD2233501.1 site-2 protease family protein [Phormidium tenue FACHB-1052]OKH48613.1 site-2 protease family protein [Phormidium tenue NIES-30]
MQSNWRVGAILGIPLFVDSSWFIILLLVTVSYGLEPSWHSAWGNLAWVMGFGLALLLFASVLLHELGHSLAAKGQGIAVNSITLFLFGGIASIDKESKTPEDALKVAIAGPLVSFGLFLLLTAISQIESLPTPVRVITGSVAQINLVLTLFNMIPGLPLDGGQVLKALVWKVTNSRIKGIRWAARSGQILGWLAISFGLVMAFVYQAFSGFWIAAIGWFALRNADAYNQVTNLQEAMLALTAADAMARDFKVVDADMSLRQFADTYLLEENRPPAYFAASDGRYRGLVTVEDMRAIERSQWDTLPLNHIAKPLLTIPSVREGTPLTEAIDQLEDLQLLRLTVLTPADAVAGTIDRGDVVRAIADRLGLRVSPAMIERIKEEGQYPPGLQLSSIAKSVIEEARA